MKIASYVADYSEGQFAEGTKNSKLKLQII